MLLGNFTKVALTLDKEFPGCLLARRRLQGLDQVAGRGLHGLTLTLAYFPSSGLLSTQCKSLEHPYFLCMDRSINILYARGPMLKRHLLATTGVMVRTYNPNTTQESQKKRKSEASQPGSPSDSPAISQSLSLYARKLAPSDKKGPAQSASKVAKLEV